MLAVIVFLLSVKMTLVSLISESPSNFCIRMMLLTSKFCSDFSFPLWKASMTK